MKSVIPVAFYPPSLGSLVNATPDQLAVLTPLYDAYEIVLSQHENISDASELIGGLIWRFLKDWGFSNA